MEKHQYPDIYLSAIHNLTGSGEAAVLVNSVKGEHFQTLSGTGQGDPPSAPRYDLESDSILRALKKVILDCVYRFNTGESFTTRRLCR